MKKVEESENKLRFAIDATELGTWDYDPLLNKFEGNDRLKEWIGLSPKSTLELSRAIDVIVEKDRELVIKSMQAALDYSSGGIYKIEYTIIHPISKKERIVKAQGKALVQ